jgi:hypothetical protein
MVKREAVKVEEMHGRVRAICETPIRRYLAYFRMEASF